MNLLLELKERFRQALDGQTQEVEPLLQLIRPAQNPQFGDYQANLAMPLGQQLGQPPRQVAEAIAARLKLDDICHPPEIAGPGFINLRLRDDYLVSALDAARHDPRLGCQPTATPRTFVVDFSSPNVAKPLHVGHIRSTVIGDALCRVLRFAGHQVISDNHLGDWGTQFGMISYGYQHFVDPQAYRQQPVEELGRLYRVVRRIAGTLDLQDRLPQLRQEIAADEQALAALEQEAAAAEGGGPPAEEKRRQKTVRKMAAQLAEKRQQLHEAQQQLQQAAADPQLAQWLDQHAHIRQAILDETARLHQGDPYVRSLWHEFLPHCLQSIQAIYDRLGVTFDQTLGESFYHDQLPETVDALRQAGLARDSQGAVCVFLEPFSTPFIIQKKDGAYLYATTDLATIRYRAEQWQPDALLYVVDFRQSEHFEKLFLTARRWGYTDLELRHIKFGTVLGPDGRPFQTRAGDTVGLAGLLDEAERRAYDVVAASDETKPGGWELDEPTRRRIARVVGIGALKYADLSQNRESDYVFSYDKMLSLTGNTATYMQYSYARVHGIFARGGVDPQAVRTSSAQMELGHPAERELALRLLQLGDALADVLADYRPNVLTAYLFDLAKSFSSFFDQCPVLKAEETATRDSRLLLCDLTARTLRLGLQLLGIEVVEKM